MIVQHGSQGPGWSWRLVKTSLNRHSKKYNESLNSCQRERELSNKIVISKPNTLHLSDPVACAKQAELCVDSGGLSRN